MNAPINSAEEALYKENILEHYRHPHNAGRLAVYTARARHLNSSCGDDIELYLQVDDGKITEVKFEGRGCAISIAAISMLTDYVRGKAVAEVRRLGRDDILALLGVAVGPTRFKCAFLGLETLQKGLINL